MERDEELKRLVVPTVRGRLVQHLHVWERHAPQVVEADGDGGERARERRHLGIVQVGHVRHAPLGDDVDLVGVAGEVRHERDHVLVLVQHEAAAVLLLGTR